VVTYTLQWVTALLAGVFAAMALRIARPRAAPDPFYRSAWWLAGVTAAAECGCMAVQFVWGGLALRGGAASAQMESYLRWAPSLNHSRTFLSLALAGALVALALRRDPPGQLFRRVHLALLAVAFGIGTAVGMAEGPLVEARHYLNVALWDTLELMVVLATLFAVLVTDKVDRYLWGALAVNGFSVALSIIWLATFSRIKDPYAWTPAPWQIAAYRAFLELAMVVFAAWRISLARRGLSASGMIGSRTQAVPTFSA
jgi:hypothetical protein